MHLQLLEKVVNGQDLTEAEMTVMMQLIMTGDMSDIHTAAFLTALRMKGEAIPEIVAGAKVMREHSEKVNLISDATLDTCGTGGDKAGTYNISTAVAIVSAAAGMTVVKHGNRSVSSKCGCADVLETLGVKIDLQPEQVQDVINKTNIGFLYAPTFHPAMRFVMPVRRTLGFRTIFNMLGPLSNPAGATHQILGVYDGEHTEMFAEVLKGLGLERAMVVHGLDGLDEISITAPTEVSELKDGKITNYTITPEQFGLKRAALEDIKGGDSVVNAEIMRNVLGGEPGPKRDILLLNAGAALYVAGKADTIEEGIKLAADTIDSNKAMELLGVFILNSQSYK